MEKTYIIGLNKGNLQNKYSFEQIDFPAIHSDEEIDLFIEKQLLEKVFNTIIIEFSKDDIILVMKLALHIRLTERLLEKRLSNIIFISDLLIDTIIRDAKKYGHILSTTGCKYLHNPSSIELNASIEKLPRLTPSIYIEEFLSQVLISPNEKIGRHSIANIWGAIKMEKAAGVNVLQSNLEVTQKSKSLYFKYVAAFNYNYKMLKPPFISVKGKINLPTSKKNNLQGKRVLLIDDEADCGWADLIKTIFMLNTDDFVVINERVTGYDDFTPQSKQIIENEDFDLYLLDLRLNGITEEETVDTKDLSGYKVLQKIKKINQGRQVIVFSASNKIWNLQKLTDCGADEYYLKESPEFAFTDNIAELSFVNFSKNVIECTKNNYLKQIWRDIQILSKKDYSEKSLQFKQFVKKSTRQFEIAYTLLEINKKQEEYLLRNAFLVLYQIIEDYCNLEESYNLSTNKITLHDGTKKTVLYETNDNIQVSEIELVFSEKNNSRKIVNILPKSIKIDTKKEEGVKSSTLFVFAAIGYYKHKLANSDILEFIEMNNIRNDIAHGQNKIIVSIHEIERIFRLVKGLFNML